MANWSVLKTAIASIIKTNGNQEITGQLLQNVLNNIITNVGENSTFVGIATPNTNPGVPDGNVFYITSKAGTYSNFGGITVKEGEAAILEWRGTSWEKKETGFATKEKVSKNITDISKIARFINSVIFEKGLFGSAVFNSNGYYSSENSEYKSSNFRNTTLYLKVKPGDIVTIKGITGYMINNYITAFDDAGEVVLSACRADGYDNSIIDTFYIVPDGVTAIRVTKANDDTNPEIHIYGVMSGINSNTPTLPLSEIEYEFAGEDHYYGYNQQLINKTNVKQYTKDIPVSKLNNRTVRIVMQGNSSGGYSVIAKNENLTPIFAESYIGESNDITLQFSEEVEYFVVYAKKTAPDMYSGIHIYTMSDITYLKDYASLISQKINEVEIAKGIQNNTGEIYAVYHSYRLLRTFIKGGTYYLYFPNGGGTLPMMWKYEDETYSNPLEEIIGNRPYELIEIKIEDGYYAICWNNGAPNNFGCDPTMIPLFLSGTNHVITNIASLERKINDLQVFQSGIPLQWVSTGFYNSDGIWTNSPNREVTDYIRITDENRDFIITLTVSANTNAYTVSAYNDKKVFMKEYSILTSGSIISVHLDEAVKYIRLFKQPAAKMTVKTKGGAESREYIQNGKFVNSVESFTTTDGWEMQEDGTVKSTSNIGLNYPLIFNRFSCEDKIDLFAEIQPIADNYGNFEVIFGKFPALVGTAFGLKYENGTSYLSMYEFRYSEQKLARNYKLNTVKLKSGEKYLFNIEKRTSDVSVFNVRITDYHGNTEYVENIGSGEVISGDTSDEGNGAIYGYMWGAPRIVVLYGGAIIHDFNLNYPIDTKNVKLVCTGHSFAEGNSIPNDKDKRFFALVCKEIGEDNTLILGQGGGTESMLPWVQSIINGIDSPYILICLGTNDSDTSYVCSRYNTFDVYCKTIGIHPIWLTIPPRADSGVIRPTLDKYIRDHFDHIDINGVFYDEEGNIDKSKFLGDNVHPSIEAHRLIYNIIRSKAPYLFK